MRMKFFLIFPEICASTWCLFSSSTRNIAFGSGSSTVAMTSMASSLGTRLPHFIYRCHLTLQVFGLDNLHQLPRNLGSGWSSIHEKKASGVLVVVHQGVGLFAVMNKPFL